MRNVRGVGIAGGLILMMGGCGTLLGILLPTSVTVSFVNASDFDVEVEAYVSDEDVLGGLLISELGERLAFTIPAGDSVTILRDCDEILAIRIEDADLLILGGLGPEANTSVLEQDEEFDCGDRITFTFAHSAAIADFDISTLVTP